MKKDIPDGDSMQFYDAYDNLADLLVNNSELRSEARSNYQSQMFIESP